jgi:alpha-glucosidase
VVNASSVTGLAAQRPLFINYPNDTQSYDVKYEYLYGDDVIVAPVYLPDVETWEVYLPFDPEAEWVFMWDESIVSRGGESVRVPAPLGRPPAFFRNSSDFVEVFRDAASEPLVDLPEFVPENQKPSTPAPGTLTCTASRQMMSLVMMLIVGLAGCMLV